MMARSRQRQKGGTLLEVMVALGILATSYVALLQAHSGSIRYSRYGKQISVATFLAQSKMEEVEQKLTKEGFPDMDHEEDDNFGDEGYPNFSWKLEVLKIELPLASAFDHMLTGFGEDGQDAGAAGGALGAKGGSANLSQFSGMMGKSGGAGGLGGAGGAGMINPEMLRGSVDMLTQTLEQAIREVRLTVFWEDGGPDNQLLVTTHLVQVPQAPSAAGSQPTNPGQIPGRGPGQTTIPHRGLPNINKSLPSNILRNVPQRSPGKP